MSSRLISSIALGSSMFVLIMILPPPWLTMSAGDHFAVDSYDDDGGVLVADDLIWIEDRFEDVGGTEPAGQCGELGADGAAFVDELVTSEAIGGGEHRAAAIEVASLQLRFDERSQFGHGPFLDERPGRGRKRRDIASARAHR